MLCFHNCRQFSRALFSRQWKTDRCFPLVTAARLAQGLSGLGTTAASGRYLLGNRPSLNANNRHRDAGFGRSAPGPLPLARTIPVLRCRERPCSTACGLSLQSRPMAFDAFRDWVNHLDQAGELIRIQQPVATELEITELADRQMKSPGGGKALLIEKPTIGGQISPFPVAINTMGSHQRMALSLGANSVDEVAAELGSLMKAKPPTSMREALKLLGTAMDLRHAKPKLVKSGPCKEVIQKFDAPPVHNEPWPKAADIQGNAAMPTPP